MKRSPSRRPRLGIQITPGHAARLHRLVLFLAQEARSRELILRELRIGLRTFYRELELVKRCGIKVRHKDQAYSLLTTAEQAEQSLPFPDPQLSFAELAELARYPCNAGKRLSEMLTRVINHPTAAPQGPRERRRSETVPPQHGG